MISSITSCFIELLNSSRFSGVARYIKTILKQHVPQFFIPSNDLWITFLKIVKTVSVNIKRTSVVHPTITQSALLEFEWVTHTQIMLFYEFRSASWSVDWEVPKNCISLKNTLNLLTMLCHDHWTKQSKIQCHTQILRLNSRGVWVSTISVFVYSTIVSSQHICIPAIKAHITLWRQSNFTRELDMIVKQLKEIMCALYNWKL